MVFTADFQIACNKVAQYYLKEFTEISLLSPTGVEKKVPLDKLYVGMKWIICDNEQANPVSKEKEPENDSICDYTQIFDKV